MVDEDRPHPDPLGALELVIGAVADEERFRRRDTEPVEGEPVDPGIGLAEPAGAREDLGVEQSGERRLVPDVGDVFAADGDQTCSNSAPSKLAQRVDHAGARRGEDAARPPPPQLEKVLDRRLLDPKRREVGSHRSRLPHRPTLEPDLVEPLGVGVAELRHCRAELTRPRVVVVDECLEEVEDDRARHALCRRTAVP
jgi:hypothetical protein